MARTVNDAAEDPDGDGMSNIDEYHSGTDPQDKDSVLRVTLLDGGNGGALIKFTAMPSLTYSIVYRGEIDAGAWLTLTNLPAQAGTNLIQVIDPDAGPAGKRFYKVRTP